jgi:hypothetical protein
MVARFQQNGLVFSLGAGTPFRQRHSCAGANHRFVEIPAQIYSVPPTVFGGLPAVATAIRFSQKKASLPKQ